MVIINSGVPKSGTSLVFQYQKELIQRKSKRNGQKEFNRVSYSGFLPRIGPLNFFKIIWIHWKHGEFALKTHSGPGFFIRLLIWLKIAKASFNYRDVRDVILSAIDHGERSRKGKDSSGAYRGYTDVGSAIPYIQRMVPTWQKWWKYGNAHFIKYEGLMKNKRHYLDEINNYFNIGLSPEILDEVFTKYERNKEKSWNFNKGTTFRYRTEMDKVDQDLCEKKFSDILQLMGY